MTRTEIFVTVNLRILLGEGIFLLPLILYVGIGLMQEVPSFLSVLIGILLCCGQLKKAKGEGFD